VKSDAIEGWEADGVALADGVAVAVGVCVPG
jgi:hypothetical protein